MRTCLVACALSLTLALTSGGARSACATPAHGCTCANTGEPSHLVRGFVQGTYDHLPVKDGMFLRASLVQALAVDSLGRPVPDSLRPFTDWIAHDFHVEAVWRKVNGPVPPDTVRFVNARSSMCPRPKWRVGGSYLLFAFRYHGRLETFLDCQREHPSEAPDAQRALILLDSLLPRR